MENQNIQHNNLWFNNINTLFTKDNFFEIIPNVDMNYNEKVNSITRFCMYLSLLLIVFTGNLNYLYLPLCVIILFYIVHIFKPEQVKDTFTNKNNNNNNHSHTHTHNHNHNDNNDIYDDEVIHTVSSQNTTQEEINSEELLDNCRKPTPNNPLMNLQISDITSEDNIRACNSSNKSIMENIDKSFDDRLYLGSEVVYNTRINQRNFYTMPNTKSYNDQGAFAKWLYNTPVSCSMGKEQQLKQARACAFNNKTLSEHKI
tara:strand:+ start:281 stop:1054 length:774 start_codon:yes stop_codon:yes gene_type:complete